MSKKLICLVSFVLVLGLVLPSVSNAADLNLMGWWKFDGDVLDSSGNERHGTPVGGPQYVEGVFNQALEFDGTDDRVNIVGYKGVTGGNPWSIAAWFKTTSEGERRNLICWGASGGGNRVTVRIRHTQPDIQVASGAGQVDTARWVNDGEWHHLAVTVKANTTTVSYPDVIIYLDGQDDTEPSTDPDPWNLVGDVDLAIGVRATHDNRYWLGSIDEVMLYDKALTQEEIVRVMNGVILRLPANASNPSPAGKATDVLRDVVLSWTPGEYADKHNVYFGTSFDDVNDATTASEAYLGLQSETTYALGRLEFGQSCYWRVDEVNAPPDNTIFKGDVWQFTVEPFSFPIEDVNATASSSNAINEGPENTINSSGLDADDLHSTVNTDMWLSSTTGPQPTWIQYEFDRVYKLHQMLVWNHNSSLELAIGFGVKEANIEYSVDGASWTTLGTHEFARALGAAGYAANTSVDLSGVAAKYVKITANSNWGGFMPQYGLSEVSFFYVPVLAREPDPASGTTDMDVDNVTLSWRAGREAASHEVQLSDSNQAVIDGTALVATVSEASYDAGELQLNQNYYWKIVEVNEAETPTTWEGDVWNFTAREFLVVDDFEDYNNFSPDRVFQTWIDGVGYSSDEFFPVDNPGNGSGAALGHDIWTPGSPHYDGDIMETAIVHGGAQSAPLYYDNSTANYSEATANVANLPIGQDWTRHGIKTLSLCFYGDPNNVAQQIYVKLNGIKVLYDGDATNITRKPWQAWNIDLADFGIDLSNVTELTIGLERIGAVGGSGVVYFDDISLYPYSRELITPAEPDTANLVAHYEFEGTTNDSSGNGLHGAAVGDPIFVAGKVGQAISLDGIGDYVEITGYKGILGPNAFSITAWIRTTLPEEQQIVYYGTNVNGQRCEFRVDNTGDVRMGNGGGQVTSLTTVNDGGWHHVAATIIENATNSSSNVRIYVDGQDDTQESTDPDAYNLVADWDVTIGYRPSQNDRFFMGQIDDVRIYERVLTQEEIAWLAGRTQPFDKPF